MTQMLGIPVPHWLPPPTPGRQVRHGRFCRLEALDPERHAADLFDADSRDVDGQGWAYLRYGPFADFAEYLAWMQTVCGGADPLLFAIVDAKADRALGVAGYLRIAPAAGSIEIGHLHFSPLLQRTAMATEALYLLMREAFTLGYRRLEWKCNALNEPSRRAAQRLGFRYEGTFRQATVVKGRNRDTAWFSILDGEWPALQSAFVRWLAPGNFDVDGWQRASLTALTAAVAHAEPQPTRTASEYPSSHGPIAHASPQAFLFPLHTEIPACVLRPWRPDDKPQLLRHANNSSVWRNLTDGFPHPYTVADADQWLMTASAEEPGTHLAIALEGDAVGGIGIVAGDGPERRTGRLGYWLGQCVWGRGLATAAVRAITGHAAIPLRFARIEAEVLLSNPASMRVLEKAGFIRAGMREKGMHKDGQLVDTVIYHFVPTHSSAGVLESR